MNTQRTPGRQLRVGLVQMDVQLGDIATNLARAGEFVRRAAEQGAQLVLLPELWSTGYDLESAPRHADANQSRVLPSLAELARACGVFVAGSVLLKDQNGNVRNTALIHSPDGSVRGEYSKIHLFALMAEHRYLTAGDHTRTFDLPQCTAAAAICYDLRFPELFRAYAVDGARVILLPAEWPAVRLAHWRTLVCARAIENQVFVVACNRTGTSGTTTFGGHSMIVDPWGTIIVEGQDTEDLLLGTLDLSRAEEARAQIDILGDRRADLYGAHPQLMNHQ